MIRSIHLENFQSHKDSIFHFTDGVNSIIGASDSGKTACIRALKWVITNRPSGDSFIKHGTDFARVTLKTDRHTITRTRSGQENSYTLNGQVFDAIGTDVPEDVLRALNLNDLNLQFQMDAPFLLTESSGEVARKINRIIKLDDIDSTLRNIGAYRKNISKRKQSLDYEIASTQKEIEQSDYSKIQQTLELAEMLSDSIEKQRDDILQEYIHELICIEEILLNESSVNEALLLAKSIEDVIHECARMEAKCDNLSDSINDIIRLNEYLEAMSPYLIDTTPLDRVFVQYKEVHEQIQNIQESMYLYNNIIDPKIAEIIVEPIDVLVEQVKSCDDTILEAYKGTLVQIDREISSTQDKIAMWIKELGDTCPVCGGQIEISC
jgi:DNA repair protein SbcC/Rad50